MTLTTQLARGETGTAAINAAMLSNIALPEYDVAGAPDATAAEWTHRLIYVTDGAAGSPCLAFSNGTDWLRITLGAAIAGA